MTPQVQLMENQRRDFCGYGVCTFSSSLQAYLNASRLRHIIFLEQLSEYRVHTRSSGVFKERFSTYRWFVNTNGCHINKLTSYDVLYRLCPFIDSDVEFPKYILLRLCINLNSLLFLYKENIYYAIFLISNFIATKIL